LQEPIVLGWVRDEKGNVVKRPPVEVANTVTSGKRDNTQNYVVEPFIGSFKSRNPDNPSERKKTNGMYQQRFEPNAKGLSNTITGVQKDNVVVEPSYRIRKLTERECFRLMDVPEEYIDRIQAAGISRSQQYKMAGNSIVVSCMYHIWRKLWIDTEIKTLTLF
jgi:site-specific DNA-cytosine methylase